MAQQKTQRLRLFTSSNFSFLHFCLLILTSIFLIGFDNKYQLSEKIHQKIFFLKSPFYSIINLPWDFYESLEFFYTNQQSLFNENIALKEKVQNLEFSLQQLESAKLENAQLRKTLKIYNLKNFSTIPAEIRLPININEKNKLFINKGESHEVIQGAPVINNDGLIGQVIFVGKDLSEVRPLHSSNFVINASLINGKENVFIFGNGSSLLEIPLFPIHRQINIGDIFITSGIDKIYPKGIKIGNVIEIIEERKGQFLKIIIKPFAHPQTYSTVSVIREKL